MSAAAPAAAQAASWLLVVPAVVFFALGAAMFAWPGRLVALQLRLLEWQRRTISPWGMDWQIGLMKSRFGPWFARFLGLVFVVVAIGLVLMITRGGT
jgi:hypothetical protein